MSSSKKIDCSEMKLVMDDKYRKELNNKLRDKSMCTLLMVMISLIYLTNLLFWAASKSVDNVYTGLKTVTIVWVTTVTVGFVVYMSLKHDLNKDTGAKVYYSMCNGSGCGAVCNEDGNWQITDWKDNVLCSLDLSDNTNEMRFDTLIIGKNNVAIE